MHMIGKYGIYGWRCDCCAKEYKKRHKTKLEKRQTKRIWKQKENQQWRNDQEG